MPRAAVIAPILTFVPLSPWAWAFVLMQSKEVRSKITNKSTKRWDFLKALTWTQCWHQLPHSLVVNPGPGFGQLNFLSFLYLSWANWTFPTSAECGGSSGSLILYKLVYYTLLLVTLLRITSRRDLLTWSFHNKEPGRYPALPQFYLNNCQKIFSTQHMAYSLTDMKSFLSKFGFYDTG